MKRVSKSNIRALDVLEQFGSTQRPMRLKEITDAINAPHSSTSLLVSTLVEEGYLLKLESQKHYYPAFRLFGLGSWLSHYQALSTQVLKTFSETDELGDIEVSIVTRKDLFCRHHGLDFDDSQNMVSTYRKYAIPLISCPAGWSILSDLPDDEVARISRRTRAELGPEYNLDKTATVLENVARCRAVGFASKVSPGNEASEQGLVAMRMPSMYEFPCASVQVKVKAVGTSDVKRQVLKKLSYLRQNWTDILTVSRSFPEQPYVYERPLSKTG